MLATLVRPVALAAFALGCVAPASADGLLCSQLGNLVSRPTVSTTACAVGQDSVLVESGFTNQSAPGPAGSETLVYPQFAVRGGFGPGLEVALEPPTYERLSTRPGQSGDTDGSLQLKYQYASTSRLAAAGRTSYTFGTGTPGLESSGEGLSLALDTDYALSPAVSLASSLAYVTFAPGAAQPSPSRTTALQPSLVVSVGLPANLNVFGEGFGRTSSGAGTSGAYGIDGGVSYDVGRRLQVDANVFDSIGASGGGRSHAIGFGAAYLFGATP